MKQKYIYVILILISSYSFNFAQLIYEPINLDIYGYLDRMNIKGYILLDSEVKPYTRKYIARKLIRLNSTQQTGLSKIDRELLKWYMNEYSYEINQIFQSDSYSYASIGYWFDGGKRLRLFSFEDSLFQFKISPIAGYGISNTGGKIGHNRRIGVRAITTIDTWFGGSLQMSDNGEFGDNVDKNKLFTPERGRDEISAPNGIEFSDVRAQINFNWKWGAFSFRKDYTSLSNSYFGSVILSDKAPSFPHLYFEVKPSGWFRFYYLFGSLHSGIIDSARTITQNQNSMLDYQFNKFVKKYFVCNQITFSISKWWDLSLGNSIVYAGDIRLEMFIPFNFFKYMDRDTGKKSIEDGNGALHFETVIRYPETYKFYFSTFIDATSIRGLLNNNTQESSIAYTIGGRKVDLFIDNLDLTLEYTRVNPWVYEHKYEVTNYKHLNYSLGSWLGQNADMMRLQFEYQLIRGLCINAYYERVRKGGFDDIYYDYKTDIIKPFLYGQKRTDNIFSLNVKYTPIHELFIKLNFKFSDITDEMPGRTLDFLMGSKHLYSFNVYYGIP